VGGPWQQTFTSNVVVLFASKAVPSYPSRKQKMIPHNYSSEHQRPQFHIFKSRAIETSLHGTGDGAGISISA
jgi:hypothetical protein